MEKIVNEQKNIKLISIKDKNVVLHFIYYTNFTFTDTMRNFNEYSVTNNDPFEYYLSI